jgi:hypothetical protein
MPTPIYNLTEWSAAQASPWLVENVAKRVLEAVGRGSVADRDLTAPPGTCGDGATYLVDATATGAWAGQDGKMAIAVGVNAANGWLFAAVATEGQVLWVADEGLRIQYVGAAWITVPVSVALLDDLTDVNAPAPANGDVLAWDNGAGEWVAAPAGSGYAPGGTDVALADGGTGASLADPGADRLLFWDDSAGAVAWLDVGSGLVIDVTSIRMADYVFGLFFTNTPTTSEVLLLHVAGAAFTLAGNLAGDLQASVGTNPTSSFVLDVQKNGATIATITVGTGGAVSATTPSGAAQSVAVGDVIKVVAPATPDSTAANMAFTFAGAR